MEHWESLCPGGYRFVYADGLFPPGTVTFLLSSLPRLRPGLRVCDLGCGTGLLGLLLLQRQPEILVTGLEVQPQSAELACRAAAENQLGDRFTCRQGDLRQVSAIFPAGSFDLVVCNPPYYPKGSGKAASGSAIQTARGEYSCTLEDVCQAAAYLLRWGGSFCLVHKPERLTDLLWSMRANHLELKRLRAVCKNPCSAPSLFLAEGRRGGKPGLTILPPLLLQNPDGSPGKELDKIYFRQQEDTP